MPSCISLIREKSYNTVMLGCLQSYAVVHEVQRIRWERAETLIGKVGTTGGYLDCSLHVHQDLGVDLKVDKRTSSSDLDGKNIPRQKPGDLSI